MKGNTLRYHRGGWELKSTLRELGQRYAGRFKTLEDALEIAKDLGRYANNRKKSGTKSSVVYYK